MLGQMTDSLREDRENESFVLIKYNIMIEFIRKKDVSTH